MYQEDRSAPSSPWQITSSLLTSYNRSCHTRRAACPASINAQNVTINVAFQQDKRAGSTESRWNLDNSLPYIAQRRIDVAFANKLTYEVQVCARSERRN